MNAILTHLPFVIAVTVAIAGLAVVLWRRNLIHVLMGMSLVESAVNLFLVALGYRHVSRAPCDQLPSPPSTPASATAAKASAWSCPPCRPSR